MSKPMLVALGLTVRIHSATDRYHQPFPPDRSADMHGL